MCVAVAVRRVTGSAPPPSIAVSAGPALQPVPAAAPLTAPAQGSLDLVVEGAHLAGGSGPASVQDLAPTTVRAIGSVAKVMTALAVVDARPLRAGEDGPEYTATARDVTLYRQALAAGGSTAPVSAGETFTERQLLLALLLPSGNNIAETLALWVGGTREAFVATLNRRAAGLGMTSTHFADPSGFDDSTVSTAADLVKLGRAALGQPALVDIVGTRHAVLPDGTKIDNIDTLLGTEPGWLGIKTGSTNLAGGCLLFAARRQPAGSTDPADALLFTGAVLDQPDLGAALRAAARVVDGAASVYARINPAVLQPAVSGTVTTAWGAGSEAHLGGLLSTSSVVVRAGTPVTLTATPVAVTVPLTAGAEVGTLDASAAGAMVARWEIVAGAAVPGPDWWWLVRNG